MNDPADAKKVIKVNVTDSEHDLIRLAAALQRMSMMEYARTIVVAEARRKTDRLNLTQAFQEPTSQKRTLNQGKQKPRGR